MHRNMKAQWDGLIQPKKNVSDCGISTARELYGDGGKSNENAEQRVAGAAKLPIKINGRKKSVWIDSGPPFSRRRRNKIARSRAEEPRVSRLRK